MTAREEMIKLCKEFDIETLWLSSKCSRYGEAVLIVKTDMVPDGADERFFNFDARLSRALGGIWLIDYNTDILGEYSRTQKEHFKCAEVVYQKSEV